MVLAAGYATRLYPLTRDRPKHLLDAGGRPVLEHVLDKVAAIEGIDGLYLVTNAKFAGHFRRWAAGYPGALRPEIVDDGTTSDEDKLGAIGDLGLVLERGAIDDDIVVIAGDNLFSEPLGGFGETGRARRAPVVGVYDVGRLEEMSKYNAIELDAEGRITFFEEKPRQPRSTLMAIALYYYPRDVLPLIARYLEEGNNADQPGRLVEWLYPRLPVYTWRVPGTWYDIGSKETLAEADRALAGAGCST
ncbi:MAG: nucleotidyltransferase family protein [Thermoleophilia bacterium]|nr:nucleotidyltransferase family protein [Thermoleophilia bacterium]